MKFLFALLDPFVRHPELGLVVAAGFGILALISVLHSGGLRGKHFCIFLAAVCWILFSLNEFQAKAAGWNIRVDLLVTWPVLLILSVGSAWLGVRELGVSQRDESVVAK